MSSRKKLRNTVKTPPRGQHESRLEKWMAANDVGPIALTAVTGISRQGLWKLRWTVKGEQNIGLRTMKRVLKGARQLRGPHVKMSDLFDLDLPEPTADDRQKH